MLVFYPDFDIDSGPPSSHEVVLLLDTSESMGDLIHWVQELSLRVLKALHPDVKVNVVLFGTGQFVQVLGSRRQQGAPLGDRGLSQGREQTSF